MAAPDRVMRRILVVGSPGSGKSTLARRLAAKLKLPLVHLDFYFWRAGWEPADDATFFDCVRELAARPEWVMDDNYSRTFDIRMPRADTLVWLEYPRSTCFLRALGRSLRNEGRVRPDRPPGSGRWHNRSAPAGPRARGWPRNRKPPPSRACRPPAP